MTTIDDHITDRLIQHLRNDTTDMGQSDLLVPISNFVNPERAAQERAVLRRLPVVVGHRSEIPNPGDFVTREILGTPLIIVRQQDGSVRSLVNMCRHRGGRVENDATGTKPYFSCAYHGWTYAAEGGELVRVPYEQFFESVDKSCNGLATVRTEERFGMLWADFSNDESRSLADWFGPEVERQLGLCDLEDSTIFLEKIIPLDINWKLVLDGAIDILHPKFLHPKGVGKLIETQTSVWLDYGRHGQNFSPRVKMSKLAKSGEPIEAASSYVGSNLFVYPNAQVIAAPDHIEFWTVWPHVTDPTKSVANIRFLINPDKLDDRMAARLNRSWEILEQAAVEEDWPMAASIQANAIACPEGTFRYGRNEQSCAHLHRELGRDIGVV